MKAKTVFQMWKFFGDQMPEDVSIKQREGARRMFYAGAHSMFHLTEAVCAVKTGESQDAYCERITTELETLHKEVQGIDDDLRFT